MNNIIDLKDINTYPQELINFFNDNSKLYLKDINLNRDGVCKIDEILKNDYFLCKHCTRIYNKTTMEKYGILRPIIFKNKANYIISLKCKESILNPIRPYISVKNFKNLCENYDKKLIDSFEEIDNFKKWHGKYSAIYFTMDTINTIKNNSAYKELNHYGGELFDDVTINFLKDEELKNKIKRIGKYYVIAFKLKVEDINYMQRKNIYEEMFSSALGKEKICMNESKVFFDISPNDILNFCEIEEYTNFLY